MTTTINSQLISIGKLLTGDDCSYSVPSYQRDYSWTEIEVEQFWNDIINTIEEGRSEYFFGAIVINSSTKPESLIDGQQRLATISLLMCVLRDIALQNEDTQLSEAISQRYLGSLDLRTRKIESKLTLNQINDTFYQDNFINNPKPIEELENINKQRNTDKSNKLLARAYLLLQEKIKHRISQIGDYSETVVQIEECIKQKFIIIQIAVADEANAYLIFETLNDRGLDLTVSDLLKNYLFSKASGNLQTIQNKWQEIGLLVGRFEITTFVRHYWLSKYEKVREKDLYRTITQKFRYPAEVFDFVRDLRESADIYSAFEDSQNIRWNPYGTNVKKNLEILRLFSYTNCYPLLLAAYEQLNYDLFAKTLNMIINFLFRYCVICDKRPSTLDDAYSEVAQYIRHNKISGIQPIFELISKYYVNDKEFEYFFAQKSIAKRNSKLARYILIQINDYQKQKDTQSRELVTNPNESEINLEHILSQSANNNDQSSELSEYVDRLGNMTLLDSSSNRDIGDASFIEKRDQLYSQSDLHITKELVNYDQWGATEIDERQNKMAEDACAIWRIDVRKH